MGTFMESNVQSPQNYLKLSHEIYHIFLSHGSAQGTLGLFVCFSSPVLNSLHQQLYYLVLYNHFCSRVLMKTHISFKSSSKLRTICLFSFSSPKRYSSTATTAVFFRTIWPFLPCSPNDGAGTESRDSTLWL